MGHRCDSALLEFLRESDACCPQCGYALRGLRDPACPECGFGFDARALQILAGEPPWWQEDLGLLNWLLESLWAWRLVVVLTAVSSLLILAHPIALGALCLLVVVLVAWRVSLDDGELWAGVGGSGGCGGMAGWGEALVRFSRALGFAAWVLSLAMCAVLLVIVRGIAASW